ncbi:hypothetical protein HO173_004999 [Letharia columbiana]|uniref:Uncharacterized protein n=1 Tax=Letharia columbiana TaxID=112416 RepID=A0A8H6L5T0_9LECA|nr:uncharacterized protein HO173_004999 [Letharia columbiana]KAF6236708.1 hypothetical protein HO173_004999 [Letharia columbiana]
MLGLLPTLAISTKGSILSTTSVLLMQSTIKAITMGLLPMLSNGLYLVDSISPSNAFHDQGNLAGLAPYDGNVDHGPYSVNSMATPSSFRLANNSIKFDPNAANVLDGLLPSNHLSNTGVAYDDGNHGMRDYGFGSQASGLTPAVDNTPSPSTTSGSRVDLQGRPRPRRRGSPWKISLGLRQVRQDVRTTIRRATSRREAQWCAPVSVQCDRLRVPSQLLPG